METESQNLLKEIQHLKEESFSYKSLYEKELLTRKQIEASLEHSRERYRQLTENISDFIWIADMNMNTTYISPSFYRLTGIKPEDQVAKSLSNKITPESLEIISKAFHEELENEEKPDFELRRNKILEIELYKIDGSTLWVEMNMTFIRDAKNRPIAIQGVSRDITSRKLAQMQLSLAKDTYKSILDSIPEAIYIIDNSQKIIDVNKATEAYYNLSRDEIIGRTPFDFSVNELNNIDEIIKATQNAVETGKPARFDFWARRNNGEIFPKDVILSKGNYFGQECMVAIARDISDRKKTEDDLKLALQRYKAIVTGNPDMMFIVNSEFVILDYYTVNEEELYTKPDNFLKKKLSDILPEKLSEMLLKKIKNVFDTGELQTVNYSMNLTGKVNYYESRYVKSGNDEVLAIVRNITEQVLAQEELLKLKLAFENSKEVVFLTDLNGIITFVNSEFTNLYGFTQDEVLGKVTPRILKSGMLNEEQVKALWNLLLSKQSIVGEYVNKRKDGTLIDIEASTGPILNADNEIIGFLSVQRDITERKKHEVELLQAKEYAEINSAKVTAIIENTKSSIWAFDRNYVVVYLNHVFHDEFMLSFGVDLKIGSNLLESLPAELQPLWKPLYDRVLNNEQFSFEQVVDTEIGKVYIEVSMNPILKDGIVIGGSCFGSNITERKLIEEHIKRQKEMLQIIVNIASRYLNANLADFETNIQKSLVEVGRFAKADRVYIFDYDWESNLCRNTYEWCNQNISPQISELQNVPLSMMTWWVEKHKKGESIFIANVDDLDENDGIRLLLEPQEVKSLLAIPMMKSNQCIGFIGFDSVNQSNIYAENEKVLLSVFSETLVNIKNRMILEQDLISAKESAEESEYKVRSMFENSQVGFIYFNTEGRILETNQAALDILGSPSMDKTIEINVLKFLPMIEIGFTDDAIQCIEEKKLITNEKLYLSKWNKNSFVKYYLIPIIRNDIVVGVWANLQDLTDLWQIQQEVIQAKNKAEESDKLKTAFLQNMSHEIRTPLNGIIGFSSMLADPDLTKDDLQEFSTVIKESGKRLIEMVNNILEISTIETGQVEISKTHINIDNLFEDIYKLYLPQAEKKNLHFVCDKNYRTTTLLIYSDYHKLYQIITNLINNAIKFTFEGQITFGYTLKKEQIEFFVKDTGIGIKENAKDKIFERFYQADLDISRDFEGAGIGLSICKGHVELLGGRIWVESEQYKGSAFYFSLPI